MSARSLRDLNADGHGGVQRGHRLLEDHGDFAAADAPHCLLWLPEQIDFAG